MEENTTETTTAAIETKAVKTPGSIQGAIAYVPFLFIIAALQKLEDETLMFHAKNGAGLTLFWIISVLISALVHARTGYVLNLIWLVAAIAGAFHGYKNVKWSIPGVSSWAQNIPVDKWFGKDHKKSMEASQTEPEATPVEETTPEVKVETETETPSMEAIPVVEPEPISAPIEATPTEEKAPTVEETPAVEATQAPEPAPMPVPTVEPTPSEVVEVPVAETPAAPSVPATPEISITPAPNEETPPTNNN